MRFHNPFAFRPLQVTFWTTAIYLAILIPQIWIHENVPPAPAEATLPSPVSLNEAWADLGHLSETFHPFNSHANDDVRDWLLTRTQQILDRNGANWVTDPRYAASDAETTDLTAVANADVVVFNDIKSNVTYRDRVDPTKDYKVNRTANYFEGTNVYIYIRGSEDASGDWWSAQHVDEEMTKSMKKKGVLVNAHFDS